MKVYPGRFRSTEITFGPGGRVVATVALLVPLYLLFQSGPLGWTGIPVWLGWVLPRALRDVWREVPHPGRVREERTVLMAPRADSEDDVAITDRPPPARW